MERFFCHKFRISNPYSLYTIHVFRIHILKYESMFLPLSLIIATRCCRPKIFLNNEICCVTGLAPSVCEDIGIRKFSFVAQAQFLLSPHKNVDSSIGSLKDK